MSDALNLGGPANLELIHLDEPRELAYWAQVLDVSEDQLERIVERVGPCAIDVRHHVARIRHAERQRKMHLSTPAPDRDEQGSDGDPLFALIACCVAAVATAFGALLYRLAPPSDEWAAFQRQHGCEAAANSDPKVAQLRCRDGRTITRSEFADAARSRVARPQP